MTELNSPVTQPRRPGVRRRPKHNLRVDMTPMVDLGFILITFFVMTVELSKPASMKLIMPKEEGHATPLGESGALTVLLDDNKVYYYEGSWEKAVAENRIYPTSFSLKDGIGNIIRAKQKWLDEHDKREGRIALMLLIKPGKKAPYKMVIDALDEALIHMVKKYALLKPGEEEEKWMKEKGN